MSKEKDREVQGEGDYESAEKYTKDKRDFVEAGKVDEAAAKAGEQSEEEGRDAREKAADRAKEHDPHEVRKH